MWSSSLIVILPVKSYLFTIGLSAMAEDIQRDPSQVELVKDRGQVLFCWTDDQNNPEIVKYLKKLGVDGIIYDR